MESTKEPELKCGKCIWHETDGWCDEKDRFTDDDDTCPVCATGYPREEGE